MSKLAHTGVTLRDGTSEVALRDALSCLEVAAPVRRAALFGIVDAHLAECCNTPTATSSPRLPPASLLPLGHGTYGVVMGWGHWAIKVFVRKAGTEVHNTRAIAEAARGLQSSLLGELSEWAKRVVQPVVVFTPTGIPILLMQRASCSLFHWVHNKKRGVECLDTSTLLWDIAQGLAFLHSAEVGRVHGDLKTANVLVCRTDTAVTYKLCDFGSSHRSGDAHADAMQLGCTLCYRSAASLVRCTDTVGRLVSTPADDLWGLACIVGEVATGEILFPNTTVEDTLAAIVNFLGEATWPSGWPPRVTAVAHNAKYGMRCTHDRAMRCMTKRSTLAAYRAAFGALMRYKCSFTTGQQFLQWLNTLPAGYNQKRKRVN